ncbi:AAA family ATPase [Pantoea allii]|uniref:AAA family ATPase n=1 Tax=Pantoea allii TaxID=574096 RepID=UPI003D30F790
MIENNKRVDNIFSDFIEHISSSEEDDFIADDSLIVKLDDALNRDSLFLKKLTINDYKRLRDVLISFDERLTVFVADNGYGKTTILDAIAISLSWLKSNIQKGGKPGTYIREADINNSEDAQYASIASMFKVQSLNVKLLITNVKQGLPLKRSNDLQQMKILASMYRYVNTYLENSSLPLMAYYSIARSSVGSGVDNKRKSTKSKFNWSKLDAYDDVYFDKNNFSDFLNWFVFLHNKSYQESNSKNIYNKEKLKTEVDDINDTLHQLESISNIDDSILTALKKNRDVKLSILDSINNDIHAKSHFENVKDAILKFLPEFQSIELEYTDRDVVFSLKKNNVTLDIQQLSQGEKSVLTLVGDLAFRLSLLNPGLINPFEGKGIVLIDEIDLHLHPSWQQKIIQRLLETFPNLQFIISTHSPQVLSTVSSESIRILEESEDELGELKIKAIKPRYQTRGLTNSDALLYGMKTDPTPPVKEVEWLNQYKILIELNEFDSSDAQELREKLDEHFGVEHPLIQECDELISLMKFKRKLKKI